MSHINRLARRCVQWVDNGKPTSRRRSHRRFGVTPVQIERCEERVLLAAPTVVDPNLAVREVATGLAAPTSMAFLGDVEDGFFVLEKNTGQVKLIQPGAAPVVVLDLAVNNASERGLLGIALHPDFPDNPGVYLYWTESTTGSDTSNADETTLLGNRVDRFVWDAATQTLTHDQNIVQLRALQPPNPPHETRTFGNHDGGVLRFGPDGKLYIFIGDVGRRGQTQNLPDGPFGDGSPDDQFGGPEPDDAHLTGVILRLNDDGSTPADNPFFAAGAAIGGEVGENIQTIFSYGHRNAFGLAFDPTSRGTGNLWVAENGDDSFTELNLVEPGMNGGWIQVMGPLERIEQFKAIETDSTTIDPVTGRPYFGLQQNRWSPENIADTPEEALSRLFMLPGAHYSDPEFSWKFEVAPAGIGFLDSRALGPQYQGDLFVGAARAFLEGGNLFRFDLTGNREKIAVDDPRLEDRVADNNHKFDITESESLLFGRDFGIATDIQTGPNGNLFVVSLTSGAVYEIHRVAPPGKGKGPPESRPGRVDNDVDAILGRNFVAPLSGDQEVPARETRARGLAKFQLSKDGSELEFKLIAANIENVVAAHIHLGPPDANGPVVAFLFGPAPAGGGRFSGVLAEGTITSADLVGPLAGEPLSVLIEAMRAGNTYVNVHTNDGEGPVNTGPGDFPGGEIRGQIRLAGPGGNSAASHAASNALDSVFGDEGVLDEVLGFASNASKQRGRR